MAESRTVTVPVVVERDEDGVWCAHAQLRPSLGAHGEGDIAAQQHYRAEHSQQYTTELAGIAGQIRATEAAIDRYLTAFENGTLDETVCGHRIRDLTTKLDQLTRRRTELSEVLDSQPKPPSPEAVDQLRRDLAPRPRPRHPRPEEGDHRHPRCRDPDPGRPAHPHLQDPHRRNRANRNPG